MRLHVLFLLWNLLLRCILLLRRASRSASCSCYAHRDHDRRQYFIYSKQWWIWRMGEAIIRFRLPLCISLWLVYILSFTLCIFESIPTLTGPLQTATVHQISSAEPVFKSHADPSLQKPLEDIMKKLAKIIEDFGTQLCYFLPFVSELIHFSGNFTRYAYRYGILPSYSEDIQLVLQTQEPRLYVPSLLPNLLVVPF
jgi:hypothetical protein